MSEALPWLRQQIEADQARAAARLLSRRRPVRPGAYRLSLRERVAGCDAKLALLDSITKWADACDGPDTVYIDFFVARELAALIASGYRHRPGWAEHWETPAAAS